MFETKVSVVCCLFMFVCDEIASHITHHIIPNEITMNVN